MVEIVGHLQTKGRDNREPKLRPKPARQSSTLLMSGDGKRSVGHRPQATAPILDSLPPQCGPDLKADEKVEWCRPHLLGKLRVSNYQALYFVLRCAAA